MVVFFNITLNARFSVPIIQLKNINLQEYRVVKVAVERGEKRTIYNKNDIYLKIWDKKYWRVAHFLKALEVDFYDRNNAALIGLIYDQGYCRGYVTQAGTLENNIQKNGTLYPLNEQKNQLYIDFYRSLLQKTEQLQMAYIDLTPINIMMMPDGKFKIIDLESVVPITELDRKFIKSFAKRKLYPQDYKNFIIRLRNKK